MEMMNGLSNSELGDCCILNRVRNLRNFDMKDIKEYALSHFGEYSGLVIQYMFHSKRNIEE